LQWHGKNIPFCTSPERRKLCSQFIFGACVLNSCLSQQFSISTTLLCLTNCTVIATGFSHLFSIERLGKAQFLFYTHNPSEHGAIQIVSLYHTQSIYVQSCRPATERKKNTRSRHRPAAQTLAGEAAECLAAFRMAADAARMADSPGGAPGSRRLDLRHRRSHSNDQHLTVSASGSLSLHHHHQPHGTFGYYINHNSCSGKKF
jgi:hypothetical protein